MMSSDSIFQVNLSGVLKVFSDSLYSSWEVFIRELLQNGSDALTARANKGDNFNPEIKIDFFDSDGERTLILADNGIGLTAKDMEDFLSKIGSSSKANTENIFDREQQGFIGQFGIGLLSCFMVSEVIEVHSTSAHQQKTMKWVGKTDGTYAITEEDFNDKVGTIVKLKLKQTIDLDDAKLRSLLHKYGDFLPIKVTYSYNVDEEITFNREFPWVKNQIGDATLRFGNNLFGDQFQFYFPIQDKTGETTGIAYIIPRQTHVGTSNKHTVFVKNMFITDKSENILPEWAFFVKVVINSTNLSTTASREDIYQNNILLSVKQSLGQSIKDYLLALSKDDPETLNIIITIHGQALKSLALTDDEFFLFIVDWFVFPTSQGKLSLHEIKQKTDDIIFVSDIDEFRQINTIAQANDQLIINAGYIYDASILNHLKELTSTLKIQQVDAQFFGEILTDIEVEVYDLHSVVIEKMQRALIEYDVEVDIKLFDPKNLPAMFYLSQDEIERRDFENIQNETDDLWSDVTDSVMDLSVGFKSKLFLNFENPIVQKLLVLQDDKQLSNYIQMLYFNALLMGHYPMSNKELSSMNENLLEVIKLSL